MSKEKMGLLHRTFDLWIPKALKPGPTHGFGMPALARFIGLFQAVFMGAGWLCSSAFAQDKLPAEGTFKNEPAARASYDQMVEAMRKADTLSWVGDYRWEAEGRTIGHAAYRILF